MKSETEIRANIMKRVNTIYFLRQVSNPAIRVGAFIASIFLILQSVSLNNIISNALQTSGIPGFFRFALSAITDTEPMIQVFLLIAGLIIVWFVYENIQREAMLREMGL